MIFGCGGRCSCRACAQARAHHLGASGGLRITSRFGPRVNPVTHKAHTHTGIDIDGETGDHIFAARPGRVSRLDVDGVGKGLVNGNAVHVLDRWGWTWSYLHLSRILIPLGAQVVAGQLLGLMGSTGRSTGSHLHLSVRTPGGQYVDPLPLFPAGVFRA